MDSTSNVSSKFKFHQLDQLIYRRFIELLFNDITNNSFSLTNKMNYINSVQLRGINLKFLETFQSSLVRCKNGRMLMRISTDINFYKYKEKRLYNFFPYMRVVSVDVLVNNNEFTEFFLPRTYKKLIHFNSLADIDRVANIYYHKDIKFIKGDLFIFYCKKAFSYSAINSTINLMPVEKYLFEILKEDKNDTVEELIKELQIPNVVRSITVVHTGHYKPGLDKENWVVTN